MEEGQVLARVDDTLAQMEYIEAQQALEELYSAASIAEHKLAEAQAARQAGGGNAVPPMLMNTLIEYLQEKAGL